MTALRINLDGEVAGAAFVRATTRAGDKVRAAMRATAQRTGDSILERGRADIQGAGYKGSFVDGLAVKVTESGGHIKLSVTHDDPKFWIRETGGIIKGKPLLWIPLSSAPEAKGINARDFPQRLVQVHRISGGVPLLLSIQDRKPKYFGTSQVTVKKVFHVEEIVKEEASKVKDTYKSIYPTVG